MHNDDVPHVPYVIKEYWRIPFPVQGIQVTEENMQEVANWCKGKLSSREHDRVDDAPRFIKVKVEHAITDKQTRARVGDYILRSPSGFKVYTEQAFNKCFGEKQEKIDNVDYRDAGTGQYVSEEFAADHPATTVSETNQVHEDGSVCDAEVRED